MIKGSCLCGGVVFSVKVFTGPFEMCHCSRCRKTTGSAFMAGIYTKKENLVLEAGKELVQEYQAPLLTKPPAYKVIFCSDCGSPLPDFDATSDFVEVPAGLLDDDPQLRPDRHIFYDHKAPWLLGLDDLPTFTEAEIKKFRNN